MGVKIREKSGHYYLDIYYHGLRQWEATGLSVSTDHEQNKEVLRLAEIMRSKRETQILTGELGILDKAGGKKSLYLYAQEVEKTKGSKSILKKALKYLEAFKGGKEIQLAQVNERWIENFQNYLLKDTGLKKITASKYAMEIRLVLNKAVRDNLIIRNPASSVRGISVLESDKLILSTEELQRLARVQIGGKLGGEVRKGFLFCCFTGLRISDLKTLTWGDIDRNPLQLKKRQEKTGRFVYIPLNTNAWALIDDGTLHNRKDLVFPLIGTTGTSTNQYLVAWAKKAEIDKQIGWHTARHTFATTALESGADFFTVSKLLGHTKTTTTAVYTKATDKLKREAVNALPEIELEVQGAGK